MKKTYVVTFKNGDTLGFKSKKVADAYAKLYDLKRPVLVVEK